MSAPDLEDVDLSYTRALRMRIVDEMIKKGIPDDIKDKALILQTLDGIDRAALTKKRIKSDEGISNNKALAAEMLAQVFNDSRLKKLGEVLIEDAVVREIPRLSDELTMPTIVDGELDGVGGTENYDSFMRRIGPGESSLEEETPPPY